MFLLTVLSEGSIPGLSLWLGDGCLLHVFTSSFFFVTKLPLHLRISVVSDKGPPYWFHGLPRWLSGKESAWQETLVPTLGQEDPLEKEMAAHSSLLAWKIPWTEEPGKLQSMGLEKRRT